MVIHIPVEPHTRIQSLDGTVLQVTGGPLICNVLPSLFVVPSICSEEDGVIRLSFVFRAVDRTLLEYWALISAHEFFGARSNVDRGVMEAFQPDCIATGVLDTRNTYDLVDAFGVHRTGRLKYTAVEMAVMVWDVSLLVRLHWVPDPNAPQDRATTFTRRELSDFLWRATPSSLITRCAATRGRGIAISRLADSDELVSLPCSPIAVCT